MCCIVLLCLFICVACRLLCFLALRCVPSISDFCQDTTFYLNDYENYTNQQFHTALGGRYLPLRSDAAMQFNYNLTVQSWMEQRSYVGNAIAKLLEQHPKRKAAAAEAAASASDPVSDLGVAIQSTLQQLAHDTAHTPATPEALTEQGYVLHPHPPAANTTVSFVCGLSIGSVLALSASLELNARAEIERLDVAHSTTGRRRSWSRLGLFTYQTLDDDDFTRFDKDYGFPKCGPNTTTIQCHNFNKPNMSAVVEARHVEKTPTLVQLWYKPQQQQQQQQQQQKSQSQPRGFNTATSPAHVQPPAGSISACSFRLLGSMEDGGLHDSAGAPAHTWTAFDLSLASSNSNSNSNNGTNLDAFQS